MKEEHIPMNVFVEPIGTFTNVVLCEAITDSGGTPRIEKIKYGKKIVPTLEMTPDLLKKAYDSVADLNNELKFKVYAKINDQIQRYRLLEPRKRTGVKISKALLKKIKEKRKEIKS